jgi:hypothetical protein
VVHGAAWAGHRQARTPQHPRGQVTVPGHSTALRIRDPGQGRCSLPDFHPTMTPLMETIVNFL